MSDSCPDCGTKLSKGICPNCAEELYIYNTQFEDLPEDISDEFMQKVLEQEAKYDKSE